MSHHVRSDGLPNGGGRPDFEADSPAGTERKPNCMHATLVSLIVLILSRANSRYCMAIFVLFDSHFITNQYLNRYPVFGFCFSSIEGWPNDCQIGV